jgi:hypothetical protein
MICVPSGHNMGVRGCVQGLALNLQERSPLNLYVLVQQLYKSTAH